MEPLDMETAKYLVNRLIHEYDSQTYMTSVEEVSSGELYNVTFQRGYHSYVQEIETERFASWFESDIPSDDLIHFVKQIVEELVD
jgi:hypothetical protein